MMSRCEVVNDKCENVVYFLSRGLWTLTEATHQLYLDKVEDVGIRITQVDRLLDDGCIVEQRILLRDRQNHAPGRLVIGDDHRMDHILPGELRVICCLFEPGTPHLALHPTEHGLEERRLALRSARQVN